jgi:hypothetical protein
MIASGAAVVERLARAIFAAVEVAASWPFEQN